MPQLPSPIELRECTPADAPALALVAAATMLEAFAGLIPGHALIAHCSTKHIASVYSSLLDHPRTRAWLAEVPPGGAPVGYSILTVPDFPPGLAEEGDLELRRIYLFSRFHGGGTSRRMMDLAIDHARVQGAKRLLLGVHPENWRAIAFYRKSGFAQIGSRKFQVGTSIFEDPVFALPL